MLGLLTLAGLLTGCKSDDDITFDHERQQFETRADRILLEFIAPFGTTANEEVYIIGPFNGNTLTPDEEGKYADPVLDDAFKLTKAEKRVSIWIQPLSRVVSRWLTVSASILSHRATRLSWAQRLSMPSTTTTLA